MATGVGGGAAAGASATPASSPPANAARGRAGQDNRPQDTFAGLLAGAAPASEPAPVTPPARSPSPSVRDKASEDSANEEALPAQILTLIGGGAWPPPAPSIGAEIHLPGDVAASTDEFPTPLLPNGGTLTTTASDGPALPLLQTSATDVADASGELALTLGQAVGTGPTTPIPSTGAQSAEPVKFTLPGQQANAANASLGAPDGTAASGNLALAIGQAAGADTTTKTPSSDTDAADPVQSILSAPPALASSATRTTAPVLAGAAVAMPADPDAGFDDSFGARIGWMAEQRIGHAQIRVSPDHVGPIDVRLQLDGTRVSAEFISAHADVRQALEASVGRLRDLLDQQGLQLTHSDVGSGQPGTSGERGPTVTPVTVGLDEGGGIAADLPKPVVMRRGLLDEYA